MKQIILVGKFNKFFNDLQSVLSRYFSMQLCSDNLELLKGIMKMSRPSLIIIAANELQEEHRELFSYLNKTHENTPVLCIGNKEDLDVIKDFPGSERIKKIARPALVRDVVNEIHEILGVPKKENDETLENHEKLEKEEKKKTILLVDDAAVQLRAMETTLKQKYDVKMATSGDMAIEIIRGNKPDLILLDYDMPGCDGKETFEMIQSEENGKDVPVVFVTGVKEKARIMAVLKLKPAGYLIKPVQREDLLDMVRQVLGNVSKS